MKLYKPSYFDDFHCIASACLDSCCKEWDVQVDDDAARMYRALLGPLGDRLRLVLKDEDGETVMTILDRRCPMWREDGLCRIQAELGHDALCKTCRQFPRLTHEYGDFTEYGLELSCPEAARIIFSAPEAPFLCETTPGEAPAEYDEELMVILQKSREAVLAFLSSGSYPLPQALAVLLLYGYAVQEQIDGGKHADLDPDAMLASAASYAQCADHAELLDLFKGLEILTPRWESRLSSPCSPAPWDDALAPLARYCIQRYWLQAVSDYDLVSRVKFTVTTCILVHLLGGDPVVTSQQYSKEIENSAENMDALLDAAYTSPALTDVKLLGYLLL